jgi:hypothetical protein
MIKPDKDTVLAFAHVAQNVPRVAKFLKDQYNTELERLPSVGAQSQALASGRCQVLGEVCKLLSEAPSVAAQPNG